MNLPDKTTTSHSGLLLIACCTASMLLAFLWSYWPTWEELAGAWNRIPDYSHGYLVVPIAVIFLWVRRDKCPNLSLKLAWVGLLLLTASVAIRLVGAFFFWGSMDGWTMLIWLAGAVWFLGGRDLLRWALPSIGFLFFMIPLPYGVERWLSSPLQRIAAGLSSWILQCLGQPAIAEGKTIWMNEHLLEVEQACSGLRIFVGILALAYGYLLFASRTWFERIFLLASVIPISLTANCTRIVVTALLQQYASSEVAKKFSHDLSGLFMIPFAAGLFALALWYMRSLIREEEEVDLQSMISLQYQTHGIRAIKGEEKTIGKNVS